ncbi:phosphoadenosine phosphosulfate reductase family protein [Thioalkalivibrio sp. ALE16]|uniref:phosphoadenosine phosphosulfate reductase domain-containing protein n=1 Tax=Thioalkalivibrio sp. ALE16 TaxID=1158172 RepID=UPI000378A2E8|nr:phosphoadenosine phosphosulfate reductase family protein [Thioalkalivibrio sp. ALE16]
MEIHPMDIEDLRDDAVEKFRSLIAAGEVLAFATSFGKDSTASLNLGLEAAVAHQAAGGTVPPILVLHTDTTVENPAVRAYADEMIEALRAFSRRQRLDVRVIVSQPSLLTQWPVQVVSGRRLPTFANRAHRRCSVDYKRTPAERALAHAKAGLAEAGYADRPVVVLGTRMDESAGRAIRMEKRGEGAHVNEIKDPETGAVTQRTFAPIAAWTTDDVWAYLANAGEGQAFSAFTRDFRETIDLYKDSAGECVIVNAGASTQPAAACGARHGCWACTVAGSSDKSMETMLTQPQYAYMQRLNDLRNWLVATQNDFGIRRWISRKTDPVTGYTPIIPADYDAKTTRWLLAVLISMDVAEAERAEAFARRVKAGDAENDPGVQAIRATAAEADLIEQRVARYIERMQSPQFQVVTQEVLATIDFLWSVDALHPPHEALKVWEEVVNEGHRVFAPGYTPTVAAQKTPAKLWHPALPATGPVGVHGAVADMATADRGPGLYRLIPGKGEGLRPDGREDDRPQRASEAVAAMDEIDRFGWDAEGLANFLAFEWNTSLQTNADWQAGRVASRTEAALRYLRFGAVSVGSGQSRSMEAKIRRGRSWEAAGLAGDADPEAIRARCIPDADHAALKGRMEVAADTEADATEGRERRLDHRYARRAGVRDDVRAIRQARARMKRELPALRAHLLGLESAQAEGLTEIEGEAVEDRLRRFTRDWKEWTRVATQGPLAAALAPLYWRIEATVQARCATVLEAGPHDPRRFLWRFGLALSYANAGRRAVEHRGRSRAAEQARTDLRAPAVEDVQLGLFAA